MADTGLACAVFISEGDREQHRSTANRNDLLNLRDPVPINKTVRSPTSNHPITVTRTVGVIIDNSSLGLFLTENPSKCCDDPHRIVRRLFSQFFFAAWRRNLTNTPRPITVRVTAVHVTSETYQPDRAVLTAPRALPSPTRRPRLPGRRRCTSVDFNQARFDEPR
ncbi:Hypothetical protein CINCED_3A010415 [Cinara cedri]|uniref:Uncharacterized protein n=1 Tax=Cinara cedri TaxID=506608 RepID=A0A5E4M2C7_9HEMI|nr:Hypothetical protein CINCED_3A010415 [Cinara cedri]